jgi:NAD(P)H dehydrogenase (quinone)
LNVSRAASGAISRGEETAMPKLLVTGASGQLGQRVLANLIDRHRIPPQDIVAGSRDPARLAAWAAKGVETRTVDFEDPGLAAALAGAERMLLISSDAIERPGRRIGQHLAAVAAAKQAGIRHLVYTSMPNPEDSPIPFAPDHVGTEQAIKASGLGYTILRNAWYMELLLLSLPRVLASGQWFTATGDGRVGQVSREDCARAAAAALAAPTTESRTYTITGPQALAVADIARTASDVLGRPITVVPVTDDQLLQGMIAGGVPEFVAPVYAAIDRNTREGRIDIVTRDVETLTGVAPTPIRTFLEASRVALAA